MYYLIILFLVLCTFISAPICNAIYDPLSVPNNKFGIHVADPNDIKEVHSLINTNGGDWGYVTLVIPDSDKNTGKWQTIFNDLRRQHVIPIVRIATHVQGDAWVKPETKDIDDWVRFLNSLNWPIQNRYVILFNEPNHAKEWGNTLNPEEVTSISKIFAERLKRSNEDYFIMPASLDDAASNTSDSEDAYTFWQKIFQTDPDYFQFFDGVSVHAYPNPGFSASPQTYGKGSIRSHQWTIETLSALGVTKRLPIFITETGWIHAEGKYSNPKLLSELVISNYIKEAVSTIWNDSRIVAVTPFVYSYQDAPFDHFSWKKISSHDFYTFYDTYKSIPKVEGRPLQIEKYSINHEQLPVFVISGSAYTFKFVLKNEGQNIVDPKNGYIVAIHDEQSGVSSYTQAPYIEPGQHATVSLQIQIPVHITQLNLSLYIGPKSSEKHILTQHIRVIPPPTLTIQTKLGLRNSHMKHNATVVIYDSNNIVVGTYKNLQISNGVVGIDKLEDIIPQNIYRIVLIIPGYLPRQHITPLSKSNTKIQMEWFIPIDFDKNGTFTPHDLLELMYLAPFDLFPLIL